MNPYPWYTPNEITTRLEPFAAYAVVREHFNRLYQPETQLWTGNACDVKLLLQSVKQDEERYGWLSADPLIRELAHLLALDPGAMTRFAKINATYMRGFSDQNTFDQVRIHLLSACLLMGHWDDHIIAKKWLQYKALQLMAGARVRATAPGDLHRYCPTGTQLDAAYCELPPIKILKTPGRKWPWERVYRSVGLNTMRPANKGKRSSTIPTAFAWDMEAEPPEIYRQLEDFLAAHVLSND
jgi:hypothetical protein